MLQMSISLLFYLAFMLYIVLGVYSITLNKQEPLNRVFLVLSLCISLWALAFAAGNSAVRYEDALLWRRISSLGWGVAYSIIAHFALVLTEAKHVLHSKWVYAAIYLPAAVNVYFFGFHTEEQVELVRTAAGWASIPRNSTGDLFFNCDYIIFSLLTLILLIRWHIKSNDVIKKKHAKSFLISFGVSVLLGTITDNLVNRYLTFKIPSLAPIVILIPITTIFYFIRRYGLMQPRRTNISPVEGVILSDDKRVSLFKYISGIFFIGGLFNLLFYFFNSAHWITGFFLSTVLVLSGAVIFAIPSLSSSPKVQENILMIFMAIVIPMILFINYDPSVSNVVWPVPLFFIMVTIMFNNRKMSLFIAAISLLSGIWSWVRLPEISVQVKTIDHVIRIGFYLIGIVLTGYINRIYISRLQENEKQVRFQKMISTISADFVTVTSSNLDDKIMALLKTSGYYAQADRSYIGMLDEKRDAIRFTHEWLGEGIESIIESAEVLKASPFTWSKNKILANEIVFVPSVNMLPAEAIKEKEIMSANDIKSLIYIPMTIKEKVIGFIGFDQIKEQKLWGVEDNHLLRVLANLLSDAISKVEVEKNINFLAYYDRLTGLPNRTLFNNRLDQAIALAERNAKQIGVMFIDLDGFKAVNDTLGHDWGDYLLKQVGDRLSGSVRKYDTVARFGGDEYLIMIPQISGIEDIEEVAKRIMRIFEYPILVNDQEFFITASGGIALYPVDGEEVNVLIKNADLAMYSAKSNGKSQYAVCSSAMKEDVLKKMTITNSLYRALEKNELELYYQPLVNIAAKEIVGMEALLRWNHGELGLIPPNTFISIAEQTGLINPIGEWVIKTACRQSKAWRELGLKPVKMAVNISIEQLRKGNLIQVIKECLEETGMPPQLLELEITEGIAMKEANYIIRALHELKSLGIGISIDDFGMEYSSLSRLKDLPVDKLKIDMHFIHGITLNAKDESIISVIIHLAKSLGLNIVAEGVETEAQLEFLTKAACDEVQGYYYYKPMPKKDIERILSLS